MIVDPAGDKDVQAGIGNDQWAMLVVSVRPTLDDMGLCEVYIEDGEAGEMSTSTAQDAATSLYIRNGRITILGVERVGTDSAWLHIKNALTAAGRHIEIKKKDQFGGNLQLLAPAGRSKNYKLESNLAWPLNNSKLYIVDELADEIKAALENETNKFPFFHVDILDALAYVYDILGDKAFSLYFSLESEEEEDEVEEPSYAGRSKCAGY